MESNNNRSGFFINLLNSIFTNADGKLVFIRLFVTIVLLILLGGFWYRNDLLKFFKEMQYDHYVKTETEEKLKRFEEISKEQLEIIHHASGSIFSGVTAFRPPNLNYFVDLIAYKGTLPPQLDDKNLGGFAIDKTSGEYKSHLDGKHYISTNEFVYLPTKNQVDGYYMYSCPYYNLENYYSGSIFMMWHEKPTMNIERIDTICMNSARIIGRSK